ncbi:MAG: ABC transporter ATP-binding protein [Alphaproteobacteria bacterium]|nr:ABC transporter ATP-binding protein [Alphaproteobacteria bacterium]
MAELDSRHPALVVENVDHRYGDIVAADDVHLAVAPGQVVCLVGPSGCGKTTLLRLIAGLEDLQSGRIMIGGREVAGPGHLLPPEERGVGMLFQDYALFPHLSVADNVAFGLRKIAAAQRKARVDDVLDQVGMLDYSAAYPHTLSGGQQQRVALARALAPSPKVMLLDEPFSGLDQRLREQVRDQAFHVLKDSEAATLMVTHDPEEAMFMADLIAVMQNGRLAQIGTPIEIYFHPNSAFVTEFFSEVNSIEGVVADGRVATAVGTITSDGLAEGTAVDILIRPEAIRMSRVTDGGPEYPAKVLESRIIGRSSLIHLEIFQQGGPSLHLHSRVPGKFLPQENEIVGIDLDVDQAFVFSREEPH